MSKKKPVGLTKRARVTTIIILWTIIFGTGFIAMELYARHIGRFRLWSYPLQKDVVTEVDWLRKIYNKRFYEKRRKLFPRGQEISTFDADRPAPQYLFKPNLRMAWDGKTYGPAKAGENIFWSSNSWGFRGPEFEVRKKEGVIRIVCLGASTTEGSQRDEETYPYFLQQELNRMFPDREIEVINAGHHAFIIEDLLELLRQRVFPLQPDIVLFCEATNNIQFTEFIKGVPKYCPGYCWVNPPLVRFFYSRSALFNVLAERLNWVNHQPAPMPHMFDDTLPKPSVTRYREGLKQITKEALSHGTKIVLSSFITVARADLKVSREDYPLVAAMFYEYHYPFTPAEIARIYQIFNQQSAEVAREFGVPYADVAADFPREPRYFPFDIVHLTPDGNRLLANRFAEFLAETILPQLMNKPARLQR
jgi:lysophospholipase L1-like esterase